MRWLILIPFFAACGPSVMDNEAQVSVVGTTLTAEVGADIRDDEARDLLLAPACTELGGRLGPIDVSSARGGARLFTATCQL